MAKELSRRIRVRRDLPEDEAADGKLYFVPKAETGNLVQFDPANPGEPTLIKASISLRAASEETRDGVVYCLGSPGKEKGVTLYAFNSKTEAVEELGPAAVATKEYITSIDADPTGRICITFPVPTVVPRTTAPRWSSSTSRPGSAR